MTFEEYADTITWRTVAERTKAKAVWHYQQARIEGLKDELHCVRAYNDELVKAQRDKLIEACVITLEALRVMEPDLPPNAVWSVVSETLETAIKQANGGSDDL